MSPGENSGKLTDGMEKELSHSHIAHVTPFPCSQLRQVNHICLSRGSGGNGEKWGFFID